MAVLAPLLLLVAYLIGSIPFSFLVVRALSGDDIRRHGSGNVGATNVARSFGRTPGIIALLLDFGKGWGATALAAWLVTHPEWPYPFEAGLGWPHAPSFWIGAAALAAVLGHIFPVWLNFRGGKGVATAAGTFLVIAPVALVVAFVVFAITLAITRYVSLGSILAAASLPLVVRFATDTPTWLSLFSIAIAAVVIVKHHANIGRLARGEENRFPRMSMRVSIIGAGSWGTALATLAARCGHRVALWAHDPAVADTIERTRENEVYLNGVPLPPAIHATSDLREAGTLADVVIMATPSHHYREVLQQLSRAVDRDFSIISATKGIENESLLRVSEISRQVLGDRLTRFGTISGPSFALEVARSHPTASVFASSDSAWAESMQHALSCDSFRLYRSADLVGVEIGGAMKNVIAIAAGAVEGLGLGTNTMAALVTRGLSEIRRLGLAEGARPETFSGLAGMGDLILTCTGGLSRNRSLGVRLGQGEPLASILASTRSVAEGVRTCRSARDLAARHSLEMPITGEMYRVLYEGASPAEAIRRLMSRSLKIEE